MNDATLYQQWYVGLSLAAVVVLIAAGLLVLVWLAARRILHLAQAALALVIQIKKQTNSIWHLQQTNQAASQILADAGEIKEHAVLVAEALQQQD